MVRWNIHILQLTQSLRVIFYNHTSRKISGQAVCVKISAWMFHNILIILGVIQIYKSYGKNSYLLAKYTDVPNDAFTFLT